MHVHTLYVCWYTSPSKKCHSNYECVTTYYQALQPWIGQNETRYDNFNALPYALPFIFSQFNMVLGYFAMVYHALPSNLYNKNMYINIFFKKIDRSKW